MGQAILFYMYISLASQPLQRDKKGSGLAPMQIPF